MAKVVGYDQSKYKRLTCVHCCAIVEYSNSDKVYMVDDYLGGGDYKIVCPACKHPNGVR